MTNDELHSRLQEQDAAQYIRDNPYRHLRNKPPLPPEERAIITKDAAEIFGAQSTKKPTTNNK